MPSSRAARAKIDNKSFEHGRKSIPNRHQIDEKPILSRFGRPGPLRGRVRRRTGRLLDAKMLPQSLSWGAPDEPKAAKSCPKASPGHPRDVPKASGKAPKTLATPFASPNAVGSASGSIFDRFSVNAQKLRSAFRIGFYSVFSMSDVLRIDRVSRGKISKKPPSRTRKLRLGAAPGRLGGASWSAKNGQVERKSASKVPPGSPKMYKSARTKQLRARKRGQCPRRAGGPPKTLRGNFGTFVWI